jgi:hypothetical protein
MSNRKVWTCKDGTKVRIKDMTDSHLTNVIRMIRRGVEQSALAFFAFPFNGEMACEAQDNAEQSYFEDPDAACSQACSLFYDLLDEARQRELEVVDEN